MPYLEKHRLMAICKSIPYSLYPCYDEADKSEQFFQTLLLAKRSVRNTLDNNVDDFRKALS